MQPWKVFMLMEVVSVLVPEIHPHALASQTPADGRAGAQGCILNSIQSGAAGPAK